ncbi:MAG: asparaginase [Phycisphaerales bacterium]|jgi:L-asparaginase|nr:asparaginase [Phycisphaerales bacterium]MBT7171341.1 asparaginase [Phycisphaerales bacterium]
MTIQLIITGGTFDKRYDEIGGELTLDQTHLPKLLDEVRCTLDVAIELNQLIDSLEMDSVHRASVVNSCRSCAPERIVITHGTDTMVETAQQIAKAGLAKTIVLTGAMRPWSFVHSDATFNLGTALAAVQTLPHGVWIAMNGQLFAHDAVKKNRAEGIFEATETE